MSADPLADVLTSVRLEGSLYFRVECAAPWAVEAPASGAIAGRVMPGADHVIEFHAVTRGRCLGGIVGEAPVPLDAGDVICFPHGDPHVLSSGPGLPAVRIFEALQGATDAAPPYALKIGRGSGDAELICGFVGCDARPFNPLLDALPRVLRSSDREGRRRGWLSRFVEVAEAESRDPGPAGAGVLSRLSELMFVELVRRHVEGLPPGGTGWFAGLRDPHVGRALTALHGSPGDAWSLERLAREAGLARSSLADRFAALVGEPPMQYLTRWRMQVAARLLATTHAGIAEIATRVGYASEAAFNRAFKRGAGMPPATWRRRRSAVPADPAGAGALPPCAPEPRAEPVAPSRPAALAGDPPPLRRAPAAR